MLHRYETMPVELLEKNNQTLLNAVQNLRERDDLTDEEKGVMELLNAEQKLCEVHLWRRKRNLAYARG